MFKTYIKRDIYIDKIRPFVDRDVIKVLIGQRRVGKSYLLFQIIDEIKKISSGANIIYINKEFYEFDDIENYKDLLEYIKEKTLAGRKNYLFIDEIQAIEQFEKALRHLNAAGLFDIYCTGSNANLLSGELATQLSGRFIEIPVYGLSYLEFLEFHKLENNDDSLLKYIKYGGMPYLFNLKLEDEIIYDYLRNIYNTIVLKDVVARFALRNVNFLERLVEYLAHNVGSIVSAKKISDFLKSQKTDISPNTILNYLSYLCTSFFIYKVPRQDVAGKKIFEMNEKYYFEDLGLRHTITAYRQVDINKVLENLVHAHLQFLGYKIKVYQFYKKEIDFVAQKGEEKIYVQVAYLIENDKVKEREFGNLLAVEDNYPKMVVSMDQFSGGEYKGIRHLYVRDFLSTVKF